MSRHVGVDHDPIVCAKAGGACAPASEQYVDPKGFERPMALGPAIEEWIRLIVRQEIEAAFPRCPTCLTRGGHAPECGIHHR